MPCRLQDGTATGRLASVNPVRVLTYDPKEVYSYCVWRPRKGRGHSFSGETIEGKRGHVTYTGVCFINFCILNMLCDFCAVLYSTIVG